MADFSALHVALSGLRAAQLAMDTASHNVSNANTEGFTRQRVDLAANRPRFSPVGQLGLGVSVTDISRVRDNFLDLRFRSSVSSFAGSEARAEVLRRAELVLSEPDMGVSAELSNLWDAFEDLTLNPPDDAARIAVIEQLHSLVGRVNGIATGIEGLSKDAEIEMESSISDVNQMLSQVAELNISILDAAAQSGGSPNDLMDQRDLLLDRLSETVGATSKIEDNGSVRVAIGGVTLVSAGTVRGLSYDAGTGQVIHASGVEVVPGGKVRGLQNTVNTDLPGLMTELDTFAQDLADSLNSVHATGFTAAGAAGGPLLAYNASNPALSLRVAISDPADLASTSTAGPPYPQYDGSVFEQIADLRNSPVAAGGTLSLADSYRAFVTGLGQRTAAALTSADTQSGLMGAADLARTSQHGVSVDEEMVNLMEFQRMYEAAARVVTAVDQALDTVINRMGVVGR